MVSQKHNDNFDLDVNQRKQIFNMLAKDYIKGLKEHLILQKERKKISIEVLDVVNNVKTWKGLERSLYFLSQKYSAFTNSWLQIRSMIGKISDDRAVQTLSRRLQMYKSQNDNR